ncbi:MAG: glycosyltransferase family 2 protein [Burkholderiales bacterium]
MNTAAYDTLFEYAYPADIHAAQRVSVVIPLYNYQNRIEGCLESVAGQTHPNVEVVVVEDFSTDQSAMKAVKCLRGLKGRVAAAKVVSHRKNEGLATARNTGFAIAGSELVFALDADNEIYPRALERLVEAIQSAQAHVAYSQLEFFDEEVGLGLAAVWDPAHFAIGNYVDAMALVRKSAWATVGGYSKMEVMGWEDYDFWCKFVEKKLFGVYVPELLCRYRVHGRSMLRSESNPKIERLHEDMKRRHPWLRIV